MEKPKWEQEKINFSGAEEMMGKMDTALNIMKQLLLEKRAQLILAQKKAEKK